MNTVVAALSISLFAGLCVWGLIGILSPQAPPSKGPEPSWTSPREWLAQINAALDYYQNKNPDAGLLLFGPLSPSAYQSLRAACSRLLEKTDEELAELADGNQKIRWSVMMQYAHHALIESFEGAS